MKIINNPQVTTSTYRASLGDETYTINQRYNSRTKSWYLDVFNSSGETLVLGRKLLPNVPLITRNRDLMFGGNMTVFQLEGSKAQVIDRNNVGLDKDYSIVYYTLEDFL